MATHGSHDIAERFIEDLLAPLERAVTGGPSRSPRTDRSPRFLPVSPIPVTAAALGYADPVLTTAAAAHPAIDSLAATPLHVLAAISPWSGVLAAAAAVTVTFDGLRFCVWRHKLVLTEQTFATTGYRATRVRIGFPPGLRAVRRAAIRLPRGAVVGGKRLEGFTHAVNEVAGDGWAIDVEWEAHRHRLVLLRRRPEVDHSNSSEQAAILGEALRNSPLKQVRISDVIVDAELGPNSGYIISHAPALTLGRKGTQDAFREAILSHLPPHTSGRLWTVGFYPERSSIEVRLAAPLPELVPHIPVPATNLDNTTRYLIPYATGAVDSSAHKALKDKYGRVIAAWNLGYKSNAPHFLAAGPTGGGKTSLIRTLMTAALERGIPVLAIDLKMIELAGFAGYPGVAALVYHLPDIVWLISVVHAEMLARRDFIFTHRVPNEAMPLFLVVMDEFFVMSALLTAAGKYSGSDPTRQELARLIADEEPLSKLAQILALIRSMAGRIILGVQRPDGKNFGDDGTSVRDNFGSRASLSNLGPQGAYMMWGDTNLGRDLDTSVPGRAYVTGPTGQPIQAQVHWTPDIDMHPAKWGLLSEGDRALVEALRPATAPVITCYSSELAVWLLARGHEPTIAVHPQTGEPILDIDTLRRRANVAAPVQNIAVAADVDLDAVLDGVYADELKAGMYIQVVDEETGETLTGTVQSARRRKKDVLVDLAGQGRARQQITLHPKELVLLNSSGDVLDDAAGPGSDDDITDGEDQL